MIPIASPLRIPPSVLGVPQFEAMCAAHAGSMSAGWSVGDCRKDLEVPFLVDIPLAHLALYFSPSFLAAACLSIGDCAFALIRTHISTFMHGLYCCNYSMK